MVSPPAVVVHVDFNDLIERQGSFTRALYCLGQIHKLMNSDC